MGSSITNKLLDGFIMSILESIFEDVGKTLGSVNIAVGLAIWRHAGWFKFHW